MPTLHIHADESGDIAFGRSRSRHFTFAVAWTFNPLPLAEAITHYRFSLCKSGTDLARFHACVDSKKIKHSFLDIALEHDDWGFCCVVVRKETVFRALQEPKRFYPQFLSSPLRFILRARQSREASHIQIFTDRLPSMKRKQAIEKAIKQNCASECSDTPFEIFHHPAESNVWLQLVDYCCWSVHRKHETNDRTWYDRLAPRLVSPELVLFE